VKIYTRTGDRGETGLVDGTRVPKADARVEACGEVDELNATLGASLVSGLDRDFADKVAAIQRDLFALGARLSDPSGRIAGQVPKVDLGEAAVERLERWIDQFEIELPPLGRFILPGGSPGGAALHVARTVCRRAERRVVMLGAGAVEPVLLAYLNRLSDLLFVMARVANHRAGKPESEW
jgi:cob(I)alamin adenosyltransferase